MKSHPAIRRPLASILLAAALLLPLAAQAAPEVDASGAVPGRWTHDYPAAAALSRAQNLPLLLNFTGSDWCIWCKRMDASVFSTPLWKAYATNFALAFIDFPSDASSLPDGAAERNAQLQQVHRVRGFPTFVLLSPSGTPLLQTSTDLDPKSFVTTLHDALGPDAPAIPSDDDLAAPEADANTATVAVRLSAPEAASADDDSDPFDLLDDAEVVSPPPPSILSFVVDFRGLATFASKYLAPSDLADPLADTLRALNPDLRITAFHNGQAFSAISGNIRFSFRSPDQIPAYLQALSDAGFASAPDADIPELPSDLADAIALRNATDEPRPLLPILDDFPLFNYAVPPGEILYLLRVQNDLYLDTEIPCLAQTIAQAPSIPTILPAEGELVFHLCDPIPLPSFMVPAKLQDAVRRHLRSFTIGLRFDGDQLRTQSRLELAPSSVAKAALDSQRPPSPTDCCVFLPDALLTLADGPSDPNADGALANAISAFFDTPAAPVRDYLLGQPSSFALFPPDPIPADADPDAIPTPVFLAYSGISNPADAAQQLADVLARHSDLLTPCPDLDRSHRNISISTFEFHPDQIPDIDELPIPFSDIRFATPIRLSYAFLPAGILFGSAAPERFDAAIDAAIDATSPTPDRLPSFAAAFPYPDAPALSAFHADLSAILDAYLPAYHDAAAEIPDTLLPANTPGLEELPPFLAPKAGPIDASALLDSFAFLAPDNSLVLRFTTHLRPLVRDFLAIGNILDANAPDSAAEADEEDDDTPIPTSIEQTSWHGYDDAIILSNEHLAAVVVPSLGRLVFLAPSLDAPNSLRFAAEEGAPIPEGEAFYNVGGDWLWPVLQSRWPSLPGANGADWPPPVLLADAPWTWEIMDNSPVLTLSRDYPAPLNIHVERYFIPSMESDESLSVVQTIERTAPSDIPVALWQVSQVPFPDEITAEADAYHLMAGQLPGADEKSLTADDHGTFHIPLADANEFKLGFNAPAESLTALRDDQSFTVAQEFEDDFTDSDDALQLYVNHGLGYAELETLTPEFLLPPGAAPLRNHILYTP